MLSVVQCLVRSYRDTVFYKYNSNNMAAILLNFYYPNPPPPLLNLPSIFL
jgi:hypothetical protein